MEIGETLYVNKREKWRKWLAENHKIKKEIWLVFPNKASGKPKLPYDDAVEEALCFGWIDSIMKKPDALNAAQRFSPRKTKSFLSELNKERVRRLITANKMTEAGLSSIEQYITKGEDGAIEVEPFKVPEDIIEELKKDGHLWEQFQQLPRYYTDIRLGFIDTARKRPDVFRQRLNYFKKMTREGKRYGSIV